MNGPVRFRDTRATVYDFSNKFLVCCPKCDRRAVVEPLQIDRESTTKPDIFAPRRLSCSYCSYTQEWHDNALTRYIDRDWYFGLELWLQIPCCGEILYANNEEHLNFLESYVRATLRERSLDPKWGWMNQSLASRLPKWIKSAKNREQILKCIDKLRQTKLIN
jgi:hypothetical protein